MLVPDKSAADDADADGTCTSGKSSPVDDKTRKSSSDDIPLDEKGWYYVLKNILNNVA